MPLSWHAWQLREHRQGSIRAPFPPSLPFSPHRLPTASPALQVYFGKWHETPVACKVLLRGSGDIKNAREARSALSIPSIVLEQLEEASLPPCCLLTRPLTIVRVSACSVPAKS